MEVGLDNSSANRTAKYVAYLLLALVLAVVVYVRIRLLPVPLERDEGEFAYIGQLLIKGISPFAHSYTMKLPGVSMVYAVSMFLFGQTPTGVHLGLLFVNLATVFLVWLLARRLYGQNAALAAGASYALLSLSYSVLGFISHATHFVVFFSLAGFLLLLRYLDSGRTVHLAASGVMFGLALMMKQHAALLFVSALVYLLYRSWKGTSTGRHWLPGQLAILLSGAALPYAVIVFIALGSGEFDNFWFWTVQYAFEYAVGPTLSQGMEDLLANFSAVVNAQPLLWLFAFSGILLLCTRHGRRVDRFFILSLLLFSFLALCPGLVFRPHYFILLLPVAALLIGALINSAELALASSQPGSQLELIPLLLLALAVFSGLYQERQQFFSLTPEQVSRANYGSNPFPEAVQIAGYLKEHTTPEDRIAVLGSEPEIFFYADRVSATGFIYMYGLMENQPYAERMQKQMVQEIQVARPTYVVFTNVRTSWLVRPTSSRTLMAWASEYLKEKYQLVGIIDIIDATTTNYRWEEACLDYTPLSQSFITVFKLKT